MIGCREKRMKRNIRKIYAAKTAIFLGILHIACGLITMRFSYQAHTKEVSSIYIGDFQHLPIFFAFLFILSGVLGIASGCSGDVCLILVTLTFASISALIAALQLVLPLCESPEHATEMLAMPLIMLLASFFSAALTCQPLFCSSNASPDKQVGSPKGVKGREQNLSDTFDTSVAPSPALQHFPLQPIPPYDRRQPCDLGAVCC